MDKGGIFEVLAEQGDEALARVFVAQTRDGHCFELVESTQPPLPREEKWVLIVSTLVGCPVRCLFCDAGGHYEGRLTAEEILAQVEFLVRRRYPDLEVPVPHLEVQFARMGDPAFNHGVLEALAVLPSRVDAPGLLPSISSVAPSGTREWFEELLELKRRLYSGGRFQLQFSLHTTDETVRRRLIPVKCWSFAEIATYGARFREPSDQKVILNFAPAKGVPVEPRSLRAHFDPAHFVIKLTPVNPTAAAAAHGLESVLEASAPDSARELAAGFEREGYQVLLALGEEKENELGTNCGMHLAPRRGPPVPRRQRRQ